MDIEIDDVFSRYSNDEIVKVILVTDTQVTYQVDDGGRFDSSIERFLREFTKLI